MAKSKAEKQAAKAAKQAAEQQEQQDRYAYAAADGKISGSELQDIFGKTGFKFGGKTFAGMSREQQATELAKFALGNPNVQIGKGVTEQLGLKIRSDESGGRFATYTPEMVDLGREDGKYGPATPDFGKANTSWSATAGGMYRFGGTPSAPMTPPAAPAAAAEPAAPPTASLSPEALAYKQQADATLASADALLNQFRIEQNQAEEARKLQESLYIQSQATAAANMARSQMAPNLQIQPASSTPKTAGSQAFKSNMMIPKGLTALNVKTPSTLNV
jgi:hypothetical protein